MLTLTVLPQPLAICRLEAKAEIPGWALRGEFISITRTLDELSIVCAQSNTPADVKADRDWRALKVAGPLDLEMTGVLSSLAGPLAEAQINLFAVSTFDTDYLLVKGYNLTQACEVLRQAGHAVSTL